MHSDLPRQHNAPCDSPLAEGLEDLVLEAGHLVDEQSREGLQVALQTLVTLRAWGSHDRGWGSHDRGWGSHDRE